MLSVIIPVYNVEKYLEKCVNSVLSQTYTDYESILVDDGSTDSSGTMCDIIKNANENVRVIRKMNGGLSSARNAGIEIAQGEFLYFLDSDDYIDEKCFEKMMDALTQSGADMAVSDLLYISPDGTPIDKFNRRSPFKDEVLSNEEFLLKLCEETSYFYCKSCNKIIKKSVFDSLRFPEGKLHEDEATIHYIAYECKKIVCVKDRLYYYVKHESSITGTVFSERNLVRDEFFFDRVKFYQEKGMDDLSEKAALFALNTFHLTLRRSAHGGILNKAVKRLIKNVRYEYRTAKRLIRKQSLPMRIFHFLSAYFPRTYAMFLLAKCRILKEEI